MNFAIQGIGLAGIGLVLGILGVMIMMTAL